MDRQTLPGASRVRRELMAFVGVGLLVLIIISSGAALIIKQVAERHALREDEKITQQLAEFVVAPALDAVLNGNAAQRGELDRMLDSRMRDGSITEMNVWTAEGRVVYSDNPAVIGRLYEPPAEVVAAVLFGETRSTLDWTPEAGPPPSGPQVEVYVPLRIPGRVLAFEVYFDYRTAEQQSAQLTAQVVPLVVGALVLLQLVQIPIAVSLARRVRRHEADRTLLLERALSASEWERKEIASGIHDGVVQDLAGVGYAMGALSRYVPPERQEMADRLGATVRASVAALRRLMVDIYPPDLTGSGLAAAVTQLAEPLRGAGMTVHVEIEPLPAVDPEAAAALYRTARETLTNVVKHAGASVVHVWLGVDDEQRWRGGDTVRLRVTDDGTGPPPRPLERREDGHMGLKMLYDRLVEMGGDLTLRPGPGGGTVAEARVPTRVAGYPIPAVAHPRGSQKPRNLGGDLSPRSGSSAAADNGNLDPVTASASANVRIPMPRSSPEAPAPGGNVDDAQSARSGRRSWPGWKGTALFAGVLALSAATGAKLTSPAPPEEAPPASITQVVLQAGEDPAAALAAEAVPVPAPGSAAATAAAPAPEAGRTPIGTMGIPAPILAAYQKAAGAAQLSDPDCGITWPLLAAIGRIESGHSRGGQVDTAGSTLSPILGPVLAGGPGVAAIGDSDGGRLDGDDRWDRAVGPMQFIPSTWAGYATDGNADGVASPHNVYDAAATAGRYLCAGGSDLRTSSGAAEAVYRYNHSSEYVRWVLAYAAGYARGVFSLPVAPTPSDISVSPPTVAPQAPAAVAMFVPGPPVPPPAALAPAAPAPAAPAPAAPAPAGAPDAPDPAAAAPGAPAPVAPADPAAPGPEVQTPPVAAGPPNPAPPPVTNPPAAVPPETDGGPLTSTPPATPTTPPEQPAPPTSTPPPASPNPAPPQPSAGTDPAVVPPAAPGLAPVCASAAPSDPASIAPDTCPLTGTGPTTGTDPTTGTAP
ncbi:hypothetical protein GCM10009609_00680 [Pseudonocardia aurantiaca]|uniref:ATP-binding protein n=1 Tax=Pseudonocardia aurantiaca TaxID=75290 RepID=A0ABW4FE49_9PSEU